MRNLFTYLAPVALCFLVGWVAMLFQREALVEWYPTLVKSPLTPSDRYFPSIWAIIYVCMGLSLGRLIAVAKGRNLGLWLLVLAINFMWSPMFFYMRSPISGLANIILLDIAVLTYIFVTWRDSKLASLLFVPYLAWLGFATYLNLYIYLYN